ncbi:MAG TPA: MMPL family transporter [bacterium]|nr:MMPL family transporter [bacterium]
MSESTHPFGATRTDRFFIVYTKFLNKFRWPLAVFFVLLFAGSILVAKHLKLKSDFKELLPDTFQSVVDLNRIVDRVGGTGTLIVAVEGDDQAAMIRFTEDLVAKLKAAPPGFVNRVEYNIADTKNFFEKNKYLYMDLEDLGEIKDRLDHSIQQKKLEKAGLYLDFQTKEESQFTTKDLEDKYKAKAGNYQDYTDGYFFGENGRIMAVIIHPPSSATGIDFSRKLVAQVDKIVSEMHPETYHPSIKVGMTGKYRRILFEYQTLIDDIVSTALLCVILVFLCVLAYYRKFRMVVLMTWAAFCGIAWTFAVTYWHIGYLTTQTAFLGSIIVGNGINYSLVKLARYQEEREKGVDPLHALMVASAATFPGTVASSVTTSAGFGVLIMTQIKGFSHFGFIGGLGMFLCMVASYTVLPVFMLISEEIWPIIGKSGKIKFDFSLMAPLANHLVPWSRRIVTVGTVLVGVCIPLILWYIPRSLEYDFSKLRVKIKGQAVSEEAALNERVKKIFGGTLSPVVLVVDRLDQVKPLCDEISRKNQLDPPEHQVAGSCKSIFSYLPGTSEVQDQKLAKLTEIRKLLDDPSLTFLNEDQKKKVEEFKTQFTGRKILLEDLPVSIVDNFREKNGDVGKIVFVTSTDKAPLWNGKNLIRFSDMIRTNKLADGEVVTGSGESVIFADILRAVAHDGPRAILWAFLSICVIVAFIYQDKYGTLYILANLVIGAIGMGGLMALLRIKINFFNFIAIPTTFGIGVDYGCHAYQRYRLEGRGSMPKVIKTTGGAVALCSVTTVIGYLTLIIAKNQALVSFGWVSILGEITCLASALLLMPSIVIFLEKRRAPKLAAVSSSAS